MVVLDVLKDAAAAVGVAVAVDVTARCAGIFKHLLAIVAVVQQLGHHGTHLGVALHVVEQGIEPATRGAHVAVEQHRVGVHRLGNGQVVALGKAVILVKLEHLDVGELLLENLQAVVGAAVVGDDDVGNSGIGALDDRGQIAAQQFGAIPVQYDDCNSFHQIISCHDLGVDAQVVV